MPIYHAVGGGPGWGTTWVSPITQGTESLLGLSYRSEVEIDVKGNVSFDLPTPLLAGSLPNTGGKTTITLPRQLLADVAYQAKDKLTVETGFRWEDWRSFKESKVELNQPIAGESTITEPKNWHDTFAVM